MRRLTISLRFLNWTLNGRPNVDRRTPEPNRRHSTLAHFLPNSFWFGESFMKSSSQITWRKSSNLVDSNQHHFACRLPFFGWDTHSLELDFSLFPLNRFTDLRLESDCICNVAVCVSYHFQRVFIIDTLWCPPPLNLISLELCWCRVNRMKN